MNVCVFVRVCVCCVIVNYECTGCCRGNESNVSFKTRGSRSKHTNDKVDRRKGFMSNVNDDKICVIITHIFSPPATACVKGLLFIQACCAAFHILP